MTDPEKIRELFLRPHERYSAGDAAALLGWAKEEMADAIAGGEIEAGEEGGVFGISWQEVAAMATAKWSQEELEAALDESAAGVIPDLVRLAELRVRVPRYEIVMLAKLAERERTSVDDYLARHLLDLAAAEGEWLSRVEPRWEHAIRWPEN